MTLGISHCVQLLLMLAALSACAPQSNAARAQPVATAMIATSPAPTTTPSKKAVEVDYSCKTSADCAVKDVGSCCGAYPACVNRDSPTFPDKVRAQCAAEHRMSVCGFPSVHGCECVAGRCEADPNRGPGQSGPATTPTTR